MKLYASLRPCSLRCDLCAKPCDWFHSSAATTILFIASDLCCLNFLTSVLQMSLLHDCLTDFDRQSQPQ